MAIKCETNKRLVKAVSERFNLKHVRSAVIGGDFDELASVTIKVILTKEDLQAIVNNMAKGE